MRSLQVCDYYRLPLSAVQWCPATHMQAGRQTGLPLMRDTCLPAPPPPSNLLSCFFLFLFHKIIIFCSSSTWLLTASSTVLSVLAYPYPMPACISELNGSRRPCEFLGAGNSLSGKENTLFLQTPMHIFSPHHTHLHCTGSTFIKDCGRAGEENPPVVVPKMFGGMKGST